MTLWTDLADALRDATGPSRELDIALFEMCGLVPPHYVRANYRGNPLLYYWHEKDFHAPYVLPPAFTDTDHIGQIIKVIGEKLPDYLWVVGHNDDPTEGLYLGAVISDDDEFKCVSNVTALALDEAFCRAWAAMESKS